MLHHRIIRWLFLVIALPLIALVLDLGINQDCFESGFWEAIGIINQSSGLSLLTLVVSATSLVGISVENDSTYLNERKGMLVLVFIGLIIGSAILYGALIFAGHLESTVKDKFIWQLLTSSPIILTLVAITAGIRTEFVLGKFQNGDAQ